jgi:hypothetical protein
MSVEKWAELQAELVELRKFKKEFRDLFGNRTLVDIQRALEQSAGIIRQKLMDALDEAGAMPGTSPAMRIVSLGRQLKAAQQVLFRDLFMLFFQARCEAFLATSQAVTGLPESQIPEFTRDALRYTRAAIATMQMDEHVE